MVTLKHSGTIAWENLRRIRKVERKTWKHESGYHRRSLAETTMFRFKMLFGGKLRSRKERQSSSRIIPTMCSFEGRQSS